MRAPDTAQATGPVMRQRILVRGTVQGVGFRPFVHRTATVLGLSGWVGNSNEGVTIEAQGSSAALADLHRIIRQQPPPHAVIEAVETRSIASSAEPGFSVRTSTTGGARTAHLPPDLATCEDCLAELFDPANRRYRYPFINCTHCGPRYSIIEDMPYDRARTSMRLFPMCANCRNEYENPADRRFHAEPNACPTCGPRLSLWNHEGTITAEADAALRDATAAVRDGGVVAVKGIGGFHLIADARNRAAVGRLRAGKRRCEKPFAVMFPAFADIKEFACASVVEADMLRGPARPIVLLRPTGSAFAPETTCGSPWLGALLPYAPVHHLMLRELGFPVVATSGNRADEPIVTDEVDAVRRLAGVADLFLVHDRPIRRPVDNSVAREVCGRELILRRGRGLAPTSVAVAAAPGILAVGAHLKATVALTKAGAVIVSQHLGDLDTVAERELHAGAIADMARLHDVRARLAVRDLHPDSAASRYADVSGLPCLGVQHHLAHVVACMAEHALTPPVLGVAWDGTGHGTDGTAWGGEFLLVTDGDWRRVAHLRPFPLPGGDAAAREPRRAALGLLFAAFGEAAFGMTDLRPLMAFTDAERKVLHAMLARKFNSPLTSSAGRLFDAFAALTGLRQRADHEGQAAMELEAAAGEGNGAGEGQRCYAFPVRAAPEPGRPLMVDWQPALEQAIGELRAGEAPVAVSAALHRGLAGAIAEVARHIGQRRVILTGGCFQNAHLTQDTVGALRTAGFEPIWHQRIPPNDGGIALGQAVWAAWTELRGALPCA